MPKTVLGRIPADEQKTILGMLSCIIDHEDEFVNEIHNMSSSDGHEYFVQSRNNKRTSVNHRFNHHRTLGQTMMSLGLITPHSQSSFEFRPEILEAYRTRNVVTDRDIQLALGSYLYAHYLDTDNELEESHAEFDAEEFAQKLGVPRRRVIGQIRVLSALKLISGVSVVHKMTEVTHTDDAIHIHTEPGPGHFSRTEPKGVEWAVAGFPPITFGTSPNVTVNVSIDTSGLIRDLIKADIDIDVKAQAIEVAEEIKREPTVE